MSALYRGKVVHGQGLGAKLGIPTANLDMGGAPPAAGVWVVRVAGLGLGVCNVGTRPTVGGTRLVVEIHLLDFTGDLYGRELAFEPLARLRPERKFSDLEALKSQIALDIDAARRYNTGMEGNLLGRMTALAVIILSLAWIGRFTGAASFCGFCPAESSAHPK